MSFSMQRNRFLLALLLIALGALSCARADSGLIRLATTTSTDNTGLMDALVPAFNRADDTRVHVIAVGTGRALRLLREGDVDLVLVHARDAEDRVVADGYGVDRRDVMYNDFVIVGPESDPAAVGQAGSVAEALALIAVSNSLFLSRGDDSGTHKKERALWLQAAIKPSGSWYREAGQGMGKVLQMSAELDAYTLTDRGTWLAYRQRSPLVLLSDGDPALFNPYGIIAVNPERYPTANYRGALSFIDWITSTDGQNIIAAFKVGGERLFTPMAIERLAGSP